MGIILLKIITACFITCWLTIGITATTVIVITDLVSSNILRTNWKSFLKVNMLNILLGFLRGTYSLGACVYTITHDGNEYTKKYGFTSVF
jgi:hypothetical protein